MQSVEKGVIVGQLKAFSIKFNKKAPKKALGSLVIHELKTRLNERNVKLNEKETIHDLIALWAENQGKKPPVAKVDKVTVDLDDKTKKEEPKANAKDEKKEEDDKATAELIESFKGQCDSFGMQDINDMGCAGSESSCKDARPDLFKACAAYTAQLAEAKKKKTADKKKKSAGAGTTAFGHQKNAISGKIDDCLTEGSFTLKEIAEMAECTVGRVKNHINKDLKVGLRCGGVPVEIKTTKDGKYSAKLPKAVKKAA